MNTLIYALVAVCVPLLGNHSYATPWSPALQQLFENSNGFGVPATDPQLDIFAKDFPNEAPLSHTGKSLLCCNRFGFDVLDANTLKESWLITLVIDFAKTALHPVLDVGGGYGRLTKLLLDQGATVIYNDIDFRHLFYGYKQIPISKRQHLYLNNKRFPDQIDFPPDSLSAVVLHRLIHFLSPQEIEAGFKKIARWLVKGGKVYIAVVAPQHGECRAKVLPIYDKAWEQGNKWPGYSWPSYELFPNQAYGLPRTLHLMDERPLTLALKKAGFVVEKYGFVSMQKFGTRPHLRDGKEQFSLVARKG